jgi:hypothetical protein
MMSPFWLPANLLERHLSPLISTEMTTPKLTCINPIYAEKHDIMKHVMNVSPNLVFICY